MPDLEPQRTTLPDLSLSGENPFRLQRLEIGKVNFTDVHSRFVDMQRKLSQDLGPIDTVQDTSSAEGHHIGIVPKTTTYKDKTYNSFVILAGSPIPGGPCSVSYRIDLPIELADPDGNPDLVSVVNRIHIERSIENPTENRTDYEMDTLYPDKPAKARIYSEPYSNQFQTKSKSELQSFDTVLDPSWIIQRIMEIHQATKISRVKSKIQK